MIPDHKITEIYFIIDEFFLKFDKIIQEHSLQDARTKKRNRKFTMSGSEVMTILILFHSASLKNLKSFYTFYVQKHMQKDFPQTVSYNRFVELQRKVCVPLAVFVKMMYLGGKLYAKKERKDEGCNGWVHWGICFLIIFIFFNRVRIFFYKIDCFGIHLFTSLNYHSLVPCKNYLNPPFSHIALCKMFSF